MSALPLLHSPGNITRRVLIALGVGKDPPAKPWPVYHPEEVDTPDDLIACKDTEGQADGRSADGEIWEHHGVQILVRSAKDSTGWKKANEARQALAEQVKNYELTIDGTTYRVQCYGKIRPVIRVGKELPRSERFIHTVNALVTARRLA